MPAHPPFLFVTCQQHAEPAIKRELARRLPKVHLAYSRPGFMTWKLPKGMRLPMDFELGSVFARSYGFCLGRVEGATIEERSKSAWEMAKHLPATELHVWQRDLFTPGFKGYTPAITSAALAAEAALRESLPADWLGRKIPTGDERPLVVDCILASDDEWWVGYHRIHSVPSAWPGGLLPDPLPGWAVSRGYLKMRESLLWSEFPIQAGESAVEVGSSPGGAAQALLEHGLSVTGVDPAEMHPDVLAHPRFRHIQRRAKNVPRQAFEGARWLVVDINLPPNYTLDTVEAVLEHPAVEFRGCILTLKLRDWELAEEIPEYLKRIKSWGITEVRARQLHHNRQEICVAARFR